MAGRREGRLRAGSTLHALVKGTAGVARGFLPFDTKKYVEWKENVMTDPRFTDPRYNDPRLSDPVLRRDDSAAGGMWGWIAGVAVLLLIGLCVGVASSLIPAYSAARMPILTALRFKD